MPAAIILGVAAASGLTAAVGGAIGAAIVGSAVTAGTAMAIGTGVIAGGITAAQGGKASDVLKSAVLGGITAGVGSGIASSIASDVAFNAIASGVGGQTAVIIGNALGGAAAGAITSGTSAILRGQDPVEALIRGGLTAGLAAGVDSSIFELTKNIPALSHPTGSLTGDAIQRATNAAIATTILGGSGTDVFKQSVLSSFANVATSYIGNAIRDNSAKLRSDSEEVKAVEQRIRDNEASQQSAVSQYNSLAGQLNSEYGKIDAAKSTYDSLYGRYSAAKDGYENYDAKMSREGNQIIGADPESGWGGYYAKLVDARYEMRADGEGGLYRALVGGRWVAAPTANDFLNEANNLAAQVNNAAASYDSIVENYNKLYTEKKPVLDQYKNTLDTLQAQLPNLEKIYTEKAAALSGSVNDFQIQEAKNAALALKAIEDVATAKQIYKQDTGQELSDAELSRFARPGTDLVAAVDRSYTSESEARELWRQNTGTEPNDFDLMEIIGIDEGQASGIVENRANTTTEEAKSFLKELYGADYKPTTEQLMDLIGRPEKSAKAFASNLYSSDKRETTEAEALDFWKRAGFTEAPEADQLKKLMGLTEAGAESLSIRTNDIQQTTFNGAGYGTKENAEKAALAAGYNSYTWNGQDFSVPPTAQTKEVENKKYDLVEQVLKSQGTTVEKATDDQLRSAVQKVNAVPTGMLGNATLQDVLKGSYSTFDPDGTLRVEVTGVGALAESPNAKTVTQQLPPGLVLASESEVWGADGGRNPNVEYMVLPDGTAAFVKQPDGNPVGDFPLRGFSLDELADKDPEAWLQMASRFDKQTNSAVGDYLTETANNIMLRAYATGNEKLGDSVKQTLSVVTQGVGEQASNLATFFTDRLGMDHNSAMAKAGKALQDWGAANQSKSSKEQEAAIISAVSKAGTVGEKIQAFAVAAKDNPGGLMTMIAKEGVQEILPLWAAKAAYRFGTLAAVSANTAIEAIESWGAGTKSTYDDAKRMGFSDAEARTMASKVGLQSAVVTTFTNGFGDNPLVKRIIGDTVKDSALGIAKAGGREAFTEYFDGLGSNAAQQYQLTGTVNWDQATTAATIGAGVGAGTSSGIMLGAAINSNAVVGRGVDGSNVTYADFLSGAKQVDMNTVSLNAPVGTDADGEPLTLGNILAMPVASGLSYDVVKAGLPAALTNNDVVLGTDELGNTVTLSSLMGGVTESKGFDTAYKNLLDVTPERRTEAKYDYVSDIFKNFGYTPTAQEINDLISKNPAVTQIDRPGVEQYVDPRAVTEQEAKDAYAALGLKKPTQEDILKLVGQYDEAGLTGRATENLDAAKYNSIIQQIEQLGTQAGVDPKVLEQIKSDINSQITALGGDVAKLQSGVNSVVSEQAKTQTQITDLKNNLSAEIQAAKDLGLQGDAAIQAGLDSLAGKVGTNQADLLKQLGTTETALRTEFGAGLAGVSAEVKAAYDSLTADQKALADQLTQQGADLTTAIQTAQQQTQGQIGALSADMQAKYDSLSAEQKALANDMAQQGMDLTAAINLAQQQTQAQITGLGQQVDTRINELMQQGQTYQQATQQAIGELNTKNQQMQDLIGTQGRTATQADVDALSQMLGGQRQVDLAYDVTGDKQITQADIDFLTQVVSGVKTDYTPPVGSFLGPTGLYGQLAANEAQRRADLQAQQEREQAAAAAAAESQRRGAISSTLAKGQQGLRQISQQLPQAIQQAQQVSTPIYGQMGEYLDLGSPLDFDFFKPSPEKQAGTKQQQPTKIAAGGYIDDLLAGDMTADDLLNLLR